MPEDDVTRVAFHSIFGVKQLRGYVELHLNDKIASRWDIQKAKEIHYMLGAAIEAAISDELIVKFLTDKVGLPLEAAAMALRDFRELRQGSKDTVYPH